MHRPRSDQDTAEVCRITQLPAEWCGCPQHHHQPAQTRLSDHAIARLGGQRHQPATRRPAHAHNWTITDPEPTRCDHTRNGTLCGPCSKLLDGYLADLPELTRDLGSAWRQDVRFAPGGAPSHDPDEAPLGWNPAAGDLLDELRVMFDDPAARRPGNRPALLERLSSLTHRARRIIDRPKIRALTACPTCRAVLSAERGRRVVCPTDGCHYHAEWDAHQRNLLDAHADRLLTVRDLVAVLCRAGEPIDRNRINYLIRRHGLPREKITLADWENGTLKTREVWAYRLGDVRALQDDLNPADTPHVEQPPPHMG